MLHMKLKTELFIRECLCVVCLNDAELNINLTYQYAKKLHCYNYWNYVGLSLAISRRSSRRKSEIGTSTLVRALPVVKK